MAAIAQRRVSRIALITSAVIVILLGGTLALWAHYGTTIFFEMVRNGWAACF